MRDLFGEEREPSGTAEVELLMRVVGETERAWQLVSKAKGGDRKWAPKSLVSRAEPPDEDVFTMPRWIAKERGWL